MRCSWTRRTAATGPCPPTTGWWSRWAGLALVVGLGGRLTAAVALVLCMAVFDLNPQAGGGHDKLLTNALFLLVLSQSTATLALDCRIKCGQWTSDTPVPAWPRWLALYQIALVYSTTGMQKLGAEWLPMGDFAALYYSFQLPSWQRMDMAWTAALYPLTQVGTAVTWVFEVTWPVVLLALWYRHTRTRPGRLRALSNRLDLRRIYAVVGLLLHVGIWASMVLGPFSWVTLSYYFCMWHPDEYAAKWARWGRA